MSHKLQVPTYEDYYDSAPFTFVVGPEKKEFTIHSALVAGISPKLHALVHGGMKESIERKVEWPDTDVDTFIRFGKFAYYRTYDGEPPTARHESDIGTAPKSWTVDTCELGLPSISPLFSSSKAYSHWRCFLEAYDADWKRPITFADPSFDYKDSFLSHAKVYVFADYHQISELQKLSLQQLHDSLIGFSPKGKEGWAHEFLPLVRYTLENTVDVGENQDDLMDLVSRYSSFGFDHLKGYEEFLELLVPRLAGPLLDLISDRVECEDPPPGTSLEKFPNLADAAKLYEGPVPLPFNSYCTTEPFNFIVTYGDFKRKFFIHSALIAKLSPSLNALVNNTMIKSTDLCACLNEDLEAFRHSGDFVYTGSYDVGKPNKRDPPPRVSKYKVQREQCDRENLGDLMFEMKRDELCSEVAKFHPRTSNPRDLLLGDESYDYSNILITHAKVYIFAEHYGVKTLQTLSFYNICEKLASFQSDACQLFIADFVKMTRYCSGDTTSNEDSLGPLMQIVFSYALSNFNLTREYEELHKIAMSGPDLSDAA